jgi:DNA-binding response OmpR family regulator
LESPAKILIVDDEAYIRRVVEIKLANKGYDVITASNGEEGLKKFKACDPDVVITDVKMPKMDGRALYEEIKNLKNERLCLVVIITCSVSEARIEWLDKMNDTLLFEKPFSPSRLLEAVDAFLASRKKSEKKRA